MVTTDMEELEYVNGAGGVIVTRKDGLFGTVDLDGEEIVPNIYAYYVRTPNEEGQFALGDEENAVVFDRQGNVILTESAPHGLYISEGVITYSCLNEDGLREVRCYDIAEGRYIAQFPVESGVDFDAAWYLSVTAMRNGSFYYSAWGDQFYQVQEDGSRTLADERWEEHWRTILEERRLESERIERELEAAGLNDWADVGGMDSGWETKACTW